MGHDSVKRTRQPSSMFFGSLNEDWDRDKERMSVDGDRTREDRKGSLLGSVSQIIIFRADVP